MAKAAMACMAPTGKRVQVRRAHAVKVSLTAGKALRLLCMGPRCNLCLSDQVTQPRNS